MSSSNAELSAFITALPRCGKYPILAAQDLLCDTTLPCNNGAWKEDSLPGTRYEFGCPGCNVWIHYKKRIVTCNVTYTDIKITNITFADSATCWNCPNFNFPAFYWHYVNRIIRKEAQSGLINGNCDTNYRVLHYSCWARRYNDTMAYEPCVVTGCCWSKYIVCKINYIVTTTKTDSSSSSGDCNTITAPCVYICDEPGMPKLSFDERDDLGIKSDLSVTIKPNPSTGIFNCTISNVNNSELKLVVYNQLGIKVFEKDLFKIKNYTNFDFDISKQPVGVYFYTLESNSMQIANGIINLMK